MNGNFFKLALWKEFEEIDESKDFGEVTVFSLARFDFIGGWTDTPPYYFDNEAAVLNASLGLNEACLPVISVKVKYSPNFYFVENGNMCEEPKKHLILANVMKFLRLDNPKIFLALENIIPKGSGLGGSSILITCLLSGLMGYYRGINKIRENMEDLVNDTLMIEQMIGSGGGWQDQIGGMLPGIKLIETFPTRNCGYRVSYLNNPEMIKKINDCALLFHSGVERKFRVLRSIRQKYLEKDIQTLKVLNQIRLNARAGFKLLEEGRFLDFCKTMTDSWDMVNEVETKSAVEPIKILRKFCRKDLVGNKMAGAGGGGFVLAFFKDEEARGYYFKKLKDVLPNARFYHHLFGEEGLELRQGNKLLKVGKLRQI